jgi:hypothetical protein
MTEAANRPQGTATPPDEHASGRPANARLPGGELSEMPAQTETYRPLSLLALVGFGVAVLYALLVVGGGAIALFGRIPWLMPIWTFVIPAAALVLCWAARRRIQNAEGTLSGLAFSTWGARLTVVVVLSYAAYYGVTFFAVQLQAKDCAEQFFTALKRGQPERAFLQAAGANPRDMDDKEIRNLLEVRFNTSAGPNAGMGVYTKFSQSPFVRTIEMAGDKAQIVSLGVAEWGYEQGGYRVLFRYHVTTPLVEFDMNVTTFGRDSKPGEPKGRQWQVALLKGETTVIDATMKLLPAGEDVMIRGREAQTFVAGWHKKLSTESWDEVYLDTLQPDERIRQRKAWLATRLRGTAPLAGLAPLGLDDAAYRDFQAGRAALARGDLIRIDDKIFWTSSRERKPIIELLKQTFVPEGESKSRFFLRMLPAQMPLIRQRDGSLSVLFDMTLTYMDEASQPQYVVEGYVVATAAEHQAENSSAWRIEAIEVRNGRTAPTGPERPRPPDPGVPPAGAAPGVP